MPSATPETHRDVPPFPPPSTFSLLPDIYILLARLHLLHQTSQAQTNGHSQQPTQPTSSYPQINPMILNGASLIDPKDLPAQIYPLKQKLAKARAAVEELPDVDRTVEEQEREIRRLEGLVRGLKGRLRSLGEIAHEKEDVEMREADERGGRELRV